VRVTAGWATLWARRAPLLTALALQGTLTRGDGAGTSQAVFRDEFIALAQEAADRSWRELRRAVADLDERTRPAAEGPAGAHNPTTTRPPRPYRVKP
jgi:hypothetical protein